MRIRKHKNPEQDNGTIVFRRCLLAQVSGMRHAIAMVLAIIYLLIGFTITLIIPKWEQLISTTDRKDPLVAAIVILYVLIPGWALVRLWFRWKDQADEKYQQYLVAGSLSEMNKYYNEAKKYDRYTYISAGVLQGFFALSFYFLMKSLK